MTIIDAFHLPGLTDADVQRWTERTYGDGRVALRFPVLEEGAITRLIGRLLEARAQRLERMTARDIARVLAQAAARLADADDPLRRLADEALPAITGYSNAMIRLVLDRMVMDWSERALLGLLDTELAGGIALDRFIRTPAGRRVRAVGPRLAFQVFAGNVPGVAVTALVRSVLVRAATLGKTAAGEPLLTVLFARALEQVDPALGACVAITHWAGGGSLIEDEVLSEADVIIVYGGAEAVRAIRSRAPATARVIEHGPRVSLGMVGRAALASDASATATAARVAWAVSLFDQQGCVSPHVIWVERGGAIEPRAFAHRVGDALAELVTELPAGTLSASEAAAIHEARTTAEFRAIAGEDVAVRVGDAAGWTVIYDGDPRFEPSCLNRTIRIKAIAALEDVCVLIEPVRGRVQTAGLEGVGERTVALAAALADAGVTRITDFRNMPWPPMAGHHDGVGPLAELVRRVDLEL